MRDVADLPFGVQLGCKGEGEAFDLGGVLLGHDDPGAGQAVLVGVGPGSGFARLGLRAAKVGVGLVARIWASLAGMATILFFWGWV